MVVCKCRKATKLYCFVHEAPVCGECICFPEHKICVVRSYSEWVIDGEYDWPPKCCMCHSIIEEGTDPQTTRLGCLHTIHTNCLVSHIKGFPPHTAPAGYTCPACSTPIWPPKNFKDSGSQIHSKLKEAIIQSGMEKNFFGNNPVSLPTVDPRGPPPAFTSDPLVYVPVNGVGQSSGKDAALYPISTAMASDDIVEIDGPSSSNFVKSTSPVGPGATTRKNTFPIDRQNSEMSYYADDEDGNQKKYTRRGGLRHKLLRALLPFWSSALPTLPVTAPPRKDGSNAADDAPEGRVRHQKSSRMDPRKILLTIAIMACVATMGILYYRLAQGVLGEEDMHGDEQ